MWSRSGNTGVRHVAALALGVAVVLSACTDDDGSSTSDDPTEAPAPDPAAEVSGPVTGGTGRPANAMPPDLAEQYGYVEEEYFVSGDATAFAPVGEQGPDGHWTVEPAGTAPYTTRVIVRRPESPDDFNGTVVVEWFNVTAGVDADPDFGLLHPVLLGDGYAYVGLSAQAVSIEGGEGLTLDIPGAPANLLQPLKTLDPERYAPLSHPGDDYSYDIVTQVGQLARSGDLLDGETADHVILIGESQSAFRMTTYVNAVQPEAEAYDGFLVHSRAAGGAPLSTTAATEGAPTDAAEAVAIRTDLDTPVLQFETETDLVELGFLAARQPDTDGVVTWEVAGTAHADASLLEYGADANGISIDFTDICGAVNTGPQREVLRAGLVALADWVVDGTEPPTAPPIETTGDQIVRDELGLAVGGIRTPAVEAPTATLTGENEAESVICSLFGATVPFTPDQLAQLYPTADDYVDAVTESADAAVEAGFLLPDDRDVIVEEAQSAAVPPAGASVGSQRA